MWWGGFRFFHVLVESVTKRTVERKRNEQQRGTSRIHGIILFPVSHGGILAMFSFERTPGCFSMTSASTASWRLVRYNSGTHGRRSPSAAGGKLKITHLTSSSYLSSRLFSRTANRRAFSGAALNKKQTAEKSGTRASRSARCTSCGASAPLIPTAVRSRINTVQPDSPMRQEPS